MQQLSTRQIEQFINEGYVKIENAFSTDIADECRAILWKTTQCDPHNAETWTQPVIRIGEIGLAPFQKAANTPILHAAFNQLAGKGNWLPRETLGSFPIRFPGKTPAGDTGWHVDASFPGDNAGDYLSWRINIHSKGRALLMLFLFSDVSVQDAPTLIKVGSHIHVAKILATEREQGLSFMELAQKLDAIPAGEITLATGKAGTVYLCHPFIVHAAQEHRGTNPKFMAQPALLTKKDCSLYKAPADSCPVEKAILKGLQL